MKITYRLTCDDYYEAFQVRSANARRLRVCAVLAAALALLVGWMRTENLRFGHICLFLAAVFLVSLPLAAWLSKIFFKRAYRKGASGRSDKEFTVNISEDGLSIPDTPTNQEWSKYSKYSESARTFILYRSNSIETILPKRAFDLEGLESLRRLLSAKLARL